MQRHYAGEEVSALVRMETQSNLITPHISYDEMGLQLSWLERTPDKREVDGSSPSRPTMIGPESESGGQK